MSIEVNRRKPDGTTEVCRLGEGQCAVVEASGGKPSEIHIYNLSGDSIEMVKPGERGTPETVELPAGELQSERALSFLEGTGINLTYKGHSAK